MGKFSVQLKGNKAVLKGLQDIPKNAKKLVGYEIDYSIEKIAQVAEVNAPSNNGILRSTIKPETDKKNLIGQVEVRSRYAAFLEFGTGTKVSVPSGLEDYASQFKGRKFSDGATFEQAIRQWVKEKGIDEKAVWPIMMKILKVGISPKPFLFPAFNEELPKLIKRIKQGLNKEL